MTISLDNSKNTAAEVIASVDFVLVDIDGVIRLNGQAIKGTQETVKKLRNRGKRIIFATNNTATRHQILQSLNSLGFDSNIYEIMTSSFAAALYFKRQNLPGKTYIMGEKSIVEEFKNLGVAFFEGESMKHPTLDDVIDSVVDEEVNAVIIGYDFRANYGKLMKACTYAKKCGKLLATSCDKVFPPPKKHPFPIVVPGTGALVSFVETATQLKATYLGKPSRFYFDCIKLLEPNIDPSKTIIFGDSLKSDIAFGNRNGLRYTCLVQTGTDTLEDVLQAEKAKYVPNYYLRSLSDLNKYL